MVKLDLPWRRHAAPQPRVDAHASRGRALLAAVNALTYLSFRDDKRRAVHARRRIPERRLLALAALGGSPAAIYAQQTLRHKTAKQPFATLLLAIVGLQAGALAGLAILLLG